MRKYKSATKLIPRNRYFDISKLQIKGTWQVEFWNPFCFASGCDSHECYAMWQMRLRGCKSSYYSVDLQIRLSGWIYSNLRSPYKQIFLWLLDKKEVREIRSMRGALSPLLPASESRRTHGNPERKTNSENKSKTMIAEEAPGPQMQTVALANTLRLSRWIFTQNTQQRPRAQENPEIRRSETAR